MTSAEARAHKRARELSDDALMERLETGASMGALDTTAGRAYVLEVQRRNALTVDGKK